MVLFTEGIMINGGQTAARGLTFQTFAVMLEAVEAEAWTSITIEPTTGEDGELTKVDIDWRKDAGREFIQVKGYSNPISHHDVTTWASELRAERGAVHRLYIFGSPMSTLKTSQEMDGVLVQFIRNEESYIIDACAFRIRAALERRGRDPGAESARIMVEQLAGKLLLDSRTGRSWTRDELFSFLWGNTQPQAATLAPFSRTSKLIKRIIIISSSGLIDEIIIYQYGNPTSVPVAVETDAFVLADHDSIRIRRICDSHGDLPPHMWTSGPSKSDRSKLGIFAAMTSPIPAFGADYIAIHVQRALGYLSAKPGPHHFRESILPTRSPFIIETALVL